MTGPAEASPGEDGGPPADPGQAADGSAGPPPRRRGLKRLLGETAVIVVTAVVLAGLLRTFAFQTFWIPSASMTPTLSVYDRIVAQKAFFSWHDVHEGEIVVFSEPPLDRCPGPGGALVKRVIALPGQTIYSSGSSIYVDGKRLAEPYLPSDDRLGPSIASQQHPYRVPGRRVLHAGRQPF